MERFRKLNVLLSFSVLLLTVFVVDINGQADDFPGPYCATRPGGCCKGRTDACAVPISSESNLSKKKQKFQYTFDIEHEP